MKISDILAKTKNKFNWELFKCNMMSRNRISTDVIIEMDSKLRAIVELLPEIKEELIYKMVAHSKSDPIEVSEHNKLSKLIEKLVIWENE